ncbi:MAG: hypothetical protein IPK07_27575 [Deltaproteobacteria bacterium]|nr:hypothetical protein [Deltaproteobacteria bacterium]
MDVVESPQELTVTIHRDPRPDPALDAALAVWGWLEVALLVGVARLGFGTAGAPSVAASAEPWLVATLLTTLVVASAAGALLIRVRFRLAEHEVVRTDARTVWVERHAPLEVHTRAFDLEHIHELRITRPRSGDPARLPRRWWPESRLAFEVEGHTTRLGRGLDDEEATRVLEALAPWLTAGEGGERRVVPYGPALASAVPPELGEGGARCSRCGAERTFGGGAGEELGEHASAGIAWCDGCAAWVEVLREPSPHDAAATSSQVSVNAADEVTMLVLTPRPTLAARLRSGAAVLGFGATLVAAVSARHRRADDPGARGPPRCARDRCDERHGHRARRAHVGPSCGKPHRILLTPDGMRIERRRGPWTRAVQLAYERTTSLDAHLGEKPAVVARMGAVTVTIAAGLGGAEALRLAAALRYHAAHAAWRAGRTPGWVPRMELACRRCGEGIEPTRGPRGEAPDPVRCEHCQRLWPLAEALAPSLARVALEPELSDDLEVSTSPLHGTVVRVCNAPPWRRLGGFVPALVLGGGGWIGFRWLPTLGVTSLRTWSMIAVGSGVLLALRAIAIATVRAHELRTSHDALTLRRVRWIGSTARRIAIERIAAVVRPVRGRRAAEDEPGRAAVRLLIRRRLPIPGLGPERIRLGAHLAAHDQLWLARTLDKLIFETAYPPETPPPTATAATPAAHVARTPDGASEPAPEDRVEPAHADVDPAAEAHG